MDKIERYNQLIERKFTSVLTLSEADELKRLGAEIDRDNNKFYRPVKKMLGALLGRVKGGE